MESVKHTMWINSDTFQPDRVSWNQKMVVTMERERFDVEEKMDLRLKEKLDKKITVPKKVKDQSY
nr:DUF6612 family protein [Paludifilum halophilum]